MAGTHIGEGAWTYHDYAALPQTGKRYQILEGELDVTPAPTTFHQKISMRLEHLLVSHVEAADLGLVLDAPVDVLLSPNNVLQPDIVFVSRDRLPLVQEAYIAGAPDLVIEILSPSTEATDRDAKSKIYARHGVAWYWLVDPKAHCLEEYRLVGPGWKLEGRHEGVFKPGIFPTLALDAARLFRP